MNWLPGDKLEVFSNTWVFSGQDKGVLWFYNETFPIFEIGLQPSKLTRYVEIGLARKV